MVILSIAALVITFLDQICKYFVRNRIPNNIFYSTCLEFLTFGHVENYGAAFGSFSGMRWCLVAVSLFAIVAITWAVFAKKIDNRRFLASFSLILGGTLSNLFDRIVYGSVTDYIKVSFFSPVCNLGDYCISIGVFVLLILILRGEKIKN